MTNVEIALAQAYLAKSRQDPVTALIRSVRDLARMRQLLASLAIDEAEAQVTPPRRALAAPASPAAVAG